MKRLFALGACLAIPLLAVAPCGHQAVAQSVLDGSDKKAATPFTRSTLKTLETRFAGGHPRFRKLALHSTAEKKQVLCGEFSLSTAKAPADDSFVLFGATEGGDAPVVYEPKDIPTELDFREVNQWINHGADLEDLEEMGCVPEGSYRQYSDKLNLVLQHRKTNTTR